VILLYINAKKYGFFGAVGAEKTEGLTVFYEYASG
jgi:hypothetical protein